MATSNQLEQQLQRWIDAGVIDSQSADRIRAFESSHDAPGVRWPVVFAIAFGSVMVAAGVLLFVAAHWQDLSPTQRFLLVLAMIGGFHLAAGALIPRLRSLGFALHAIGTVALGGGIFLAGQIFNLQEHGLAAYCCGRRAPCFRGCCYAIGSRPHSAHCSSPHGSPRNGACAPNIMTVWSESCSNISL